MNCDQARTELIAYLQNELQGERKTRLEEHLARCPGCRHELEGARRLLSWTEAASEQGVIKHVEEIIDNAIKGGASDIHFDPLNDNSLQIRYRIDGVLHEVEKADPTQHMGIICRLKMMADLDAVESGVPLDGRIPWKYGNLDLMLRVSSIPFIFGNGIVIRILSRSAPLIGLDMIKMYPDQRDLLLKLLYSPNGILLATGPSGSGKTTTLYSLLQILSTNEGSKKMTIEDPVEYLMTGVNHSQVNHRTGYTYLAALRAMLKHDPDIIMIGELGDLDTLRATAELALTGHLMLSQMHTYSAISAIQRMSEMGLESYLISATLLGVVNQRLFRIICQDCKEPVQPGFAAMKALGISEEDLEGKTLYKGKGCEKCHNTGYRGRLAFYEVLEINNEIARIIADGGDSISILEAACNNGFMTITEDAKRKVLDGLTTCEEAMRVLTWTA